MDTPSSPSSLQPLQSTTCVPTELSNNTEPEPPTSVDSIPNHSNPTIENPPSSSKPIIKNKKKKKGVLRDVSAPLLSSCSSCSSSSSSSSLGLSQRVAYKRRNPKVVIGAVRFGAVRRSEGDVEAIALPLGMSFAAVVAQVLDRKDAVGERMSVDHLSTICTSAVRESLANVFGDKFNCFVTNFEKSFGSTLKTLRLINESSMNKGGCHLSRLNLESSMSDSTPLMSLDKRGGSTSNSGLKDCHLETVLPNIATEEQSTTFKEVRRNMPTESVNRELALHGQTNQLACVSSSTSGSVVYQSTLSTFEKSLMEQTRSNDLKTLELGLTMKKMKLKETQLSLNYDSNHLERSKLAMGISKASFKAEKFKNQLEDTRHAELLKKCIDCLVAGLIIMSASLAYGAYVYSYKKITEATASCTPSAKETKSWWIPNPLTSFNSGLHILRCQVQVVSRMLFGFLMILSIAYLLLQRSATSRQTMPVTYILLLLGVACGFAGKLCIDTLGGSGYYWLLYWETLCSLHFFSNVCTPALFLILHGHINVSQGTRGKAIIPYWIRRFLFYAIVLVFLPLLCGLMPFASPGEWKDHFSLLVMDFLSITADQN